MANFNEYHATVHFDAADINALAQEDGIISPAAAMAPAVLQKTRLLRNVSFR
jgi:hypothetical protein